MAFLLGFFAWRFRDGCIEFFCQRHINELWVPWTWSFEKIEKSKRHVPRFSQRNKFSMAQKLLISKAKTSAVFAGQKRQTQKPKKTISERNSRSSVSITMHFATDGWKSPINWTQPQMEQGDSNLSISAAKELWFSAKNFLPIVYKSCPKWFY